MQHLLNTTAIWLLSLLVFDVFLRREKYHGYNRGYLLATFSLGLLLPFWQWSDNGVIKATGPATPVMETAVLKETIVQQSTSVQVDWFMIIYIAGVVISTFLLVREALIIRRFYRRGTISKDGVWTIVETGNNHSPFSAFRYIFLSSRKNYSDEELRMILTHEEHHGHALHFVDLVLIQLAKVFLWFHPLVYLYNNRLMMVHEYQADAAVEKKPEDYGHFLIEQSILGSAPALAHSFNRSPIKKRILMLTRNTSAFAKSKKLLMAPLLLACLLFFTQKGFSDEKRKEGNKIHYKGNVFELWAPGPDTVMVEDPVTGKLHMKIATMDSFPVRIGDRYIYKESELSADEIAGVKKTTREIQEYVEENIKEEFSKLEDGIYWMFIYQVVLDEKGNLVYNQNTQIRMDDYPMKGFDDLEHKVMKLLDQAPRFTPVQRAGKPVPYRIVNVYTHDHLIKVSGHKVTF